MANYTPNISLKKPLPSDNVSLSDINTNYDKIDSEFGGVLLRIYPVGSIYMSVNATSPAELFGGTWERIQGRFLLGAGYYGIDNNGDSANYLAGDTGGEMRHTLTVAEMPSHRHKGYLDNGSIGGTATSKTGTYNQGSAVQDITTEGGNQPHNNMPPYLAVYMWKRVA